MAQRSQPYAHPTHISGEIWSGEEVPLATGCTVRYFADGFFSPLENTGKTQERKWADGV